MQLQKQLHFFYYTGIKGDNVLFLRYDPADTYRMKTETYGEYFDH